MTPREQMVELMFQLEQASARNAKAFVVVAVDAYTGDVSHACGPFAQPEQALVEAGLMDAEWREHAEDPVEADSCRYVVVPLWEPRKP